LKKRIFELDFSFTSITGQWDELYATYQILLIEIKKIVEKNEELSRYIIELENTIERYNNTLTEDIFIKQQLELLRQSFKKDSIHYSSHKKEIIEAQSELQNLRQKIGVIEAQKFTKSTGHQHIHIRSGYQDDVFIKGGRGVVEKILTTSTDMGNSIASGKNALPNANNYGNSYVRNTLI